KAKCKEIYDDLEFNRNFMACSAAFSVVCLFISACFSSNYVTKITVSLALLLVTCVLGFRVKSCNSKYALTKIDIDYMPTTNKYSKIGEHERESKLLVKRKSYLKYYKVMETNYLMMSALFLLITSVLGINSII
ncbi:permease, partial [Gardnerella pickettii]